MVKKGHRGHKAIESRAEERTGRCEPVIKEAEVRKEVCGDIKKKKKKRRSELRTGEDKASNRTIKAC